MYRSHDPLYISELTPEQMRDYYESFYKKVDAGLRSGWLTFARLDELSYEEIDAMEMGGCPTYYRSRHTYTRPTAEQIAAQRAAKKGKKRLRLLKGALMEVGPQPVGSLADDLVTLLGDNEALLQEMVGWVEQEGLVLAAAAAAAAEVVCCSELQEAEETERVGLGCELQQPAAVAAAAEEVCCSKLQETIPEPEKTERVGGEAVCCSELPAAEVCCELQAAVEKVVCSSLLEETERVGKEAVAGSSSLQQTAAAGGCYDAEWPALPSPARLPSLQQPAAAARSKPAAAANRSKRPRQSSIQHLLANPALLDSLPLPAVSLQRITLFGKTL